MGVMGPTAAMRCTIISDRFMDCFSCCSLGLVATSKRFTKLLIPYTVLLLIFGVSLVLISLYFFDDSERAMSYFGVADMDPHLMLYVFLPPLLFQSSFTMDLHIFKMSMSNVLLLATFGMVMAAITSGAAFYGLRNAFNNTDLSMNACFLLGAILSATDPVAVVALLHELGASEARNPHRGRVALERRIRNRALQRHL